MSPRHTRKNKESKNESSEKNIHNSSITQSRSESVFINRRSNSRRSESDPCRELPVDLYNRKRRKSIDRRDKNKSLADDYYSFIKE